MQHDEDAWIRDGGAPVPEDWVDDELVGASGPSGATTLVLLLALVGTTIGLTWLLQDDLAYALQGGEPLALGDVTTWSERIQEEDTWLLDLPDNVHVSLEGIGGHRAQVETRSRAGDDTVRAYYKLIGAPILVVRSEESRRILDASVRQDPGDVRPFVSGSGRLRRLESLPRTQTSVTLWYSRELITIFCDAPADPLVVDRVTRLRADAHRRLRVDLQRDPTEEELRSEGGAPPACIQAWMVELDTTPSSMLPRALLWLFMLLLTVGLLARQALRFYRSSVP